MLSPDQVASQGPGGFLNLNGGPTDPYYALSDGSSYPSVAAACDAVPMAARRNRTVNVAGIGEMIWYPADLSNAGLVVKVGSPSTGGVAGYEVRAYDAVAGKVVIHVPTGTSLANLAYNLVPKSPKPTSYDQPPLSASNPTANGINFAPDSTQQLEINELANLTGATNSFTLLDTSDNSESEADVDSAYAGAWFRFTRSDGSTVEATWGSSSQTITL